MSRDIFVQDIPKDAKAVEDIPNDFQPTPIGTRSQIIQKIKEVVPEADFTNPAWGHITGDGWSIEVNIGDSEECMGFAFHVRGEDEACGVVAAVLNALQLRAFDTQSRGFFVAGPEAIESFRSWRQYRDQVVNDKKS